MTRKSVAIITMAAFGVLVVSAILIQMNGALSSQKSTSPHFAKPTTAQPNTYPQFGFSIEYPANLQPDVTRTGVLSFTSTTTNGVSGFLSFFVLDADGSDLAHSCLIAPGSYETTTTDIATTTINGIPFLTYSQESISGGHDDRAHFFRTIYQGRCLAIADGLSDVTNLADQDASQIFATFDPIIFTLRLTSKVAPGVPLFSSRTLGVSPLFVQFFATDLNPDRNTNSYWVDAGDGNTEMLKSECDNGRCILTADHKYYLQGRYDVTLGRNSPEARSGRTRKASAWLADAPSPA